MRIERRHAFAALRIAISVALIAYLFSRIGLEALADALGKLGALSFAAALAINVLSIAIASYRWRWALTAYGAPRAPKLGRLFRIYLIGLFYNTYAPGGVGGELVRGIASRDAFGGTGAVDATASMAVVVVERIAGLSGLLILAAGSLLLFPVIDLPALPLYAGLGLLGAIAMILALELGPKLGRKIPGRAGEMLSGLPSVAMPRALGVVFALSIVTHLSVALAGYVLFVDLWPPIELAECLTLVPLAMATMYFPLTVGGAGVREATFALLFAQVGVPEAEAYAVSLGLWGAQLVVAGFGGLLPTGVAKEPVREARPEEKSI